MRLLTIDPQAPNSWQYGRSAPWREGQELILSLQRFFLSQRIFSHDSDPPDNLLLVFSEAQEARLSRMVAGFIPKQGTRRYTVTENTAWMVAGGPENNTEFLSLIINAYKWAVGPVQYCARCRYISLNHTGEVRKGDKSVRLSIEFTKMPPEVHEDEDDRPF